MKYVAAITLFVSSVTAIPLVRKNEDPVFLNPRYAAVSMCHELTAYAMQDVVKENLADWDSAAIIDDLSKNQEGTYVHNSAIDWNAPAIDNRDIANLTALGLHKRQEVDCNNRPGDISGIAICGSRFIDMGGRDDDKWGPALEAMPQWNHARLNDVERSCYPESGANPAGDGPNEGLRSDLGAGVAVGKSYPSNQNAVFQLTSSRYRLC